MEAEFQSLRVLGWCKMIQSSSVQNCCELLADSSNNISLKQLSIDLPNWYKWVRMFLLQVQIQTLRLLLDTKDIWWAHRWVRHIGKQSTSKSCFVAVFSVLLLPYKRRMFQMCQKLCKKLSFQSKKNFLEKIQENYMKLWNFMKPCKWIKSYFFQSIRYQRTGMKLQGIVLKRFPQRNRIPQYNWLFSTSFQQANVYWGCLNITEGFKV